MEYFLVVLAVAWVQVQIGTGIHACILSKNQLTDVDLNGISKFVYLAPYLIKKYRLRN